MFRVLKAIYGLKQSPACWYKAISRWLLDQGYQQPGYDQCLFHAWRNADGQIDPSQSPDDQNDDFMFIGFHVGDFLVAGGDILPSTAGSVLSANRYFGASTNFRFPDCNEYGNL